MATVQAQGGGAVTAATTNNAGGSFIGGGTTTSSNMDAIRSRKGSLYGQQFTVSTTLGAAKALSGGPLSSMTAGKYVIMRNTTELATVAKTNLQSGGSRPEFRRSIHSIQNARAAFMSAYTITGGDGQTVSYTIDTTNTTFADDHAAAPTRAVPGEFVYKTGSKIPVQADYVARTNG